MDEYTETTSDYDLDDDGRSGNRGLKVVLIGCGSIVGLVILLLMVVGMMMMNGFLPDSTVHTGDELSDRMRGQLEDAEILRVDDIVLLYYSYGLLNPAEGGSAITDMGLIDWVELDDELEMHRVPYAAIQSVELETRGDFFTDSLLVVETENLCYYPLISVEEDGDERFRDRLISEWNTRGGHRPEDVPAEFSEGELLFLNDLDDGPASEAVDEEGDSGVAAPSDE